MHSCTSNNLLGPFDSEPYGRRTFLSRAAGGIGKLSLASLLLDSGASLLAAGTNPAPQRPARAKSVICLFQHGGPSHIDLCDPKPILKRYDGKPYPAGDLEVHFDKERGNVLASPFSFRPRGECGMELSELLPATSAIADELTLIRSMTTESIDHESALRLMHTGRFQAGFPTLGSWVVYGLGSESRNLPAYVVLSDPGGLPVDGARNWSAGWLPASLQGVAWRTADPSPVVNLQTPNSLTPLAREQQLRFLEDLNRHHLERYPQSEQLLGRIENLELAARMQLAVPELLDLSGETEATQTLYGLNRPQSAEYGTRCLLARRLIEQGVRFVQVYLHKQPWDTHENNSEQLKELCSMTDQPAAALILDLKQRGLLDSTIVIWGGEFGRLPISQKGNGRDHNRHGFSLWIAGGGFRGGYIHGATDDFGYKSVENPVTIHDLHATLLHALGLEHERFSHPYAGRLTTLTDAEVTGAKIVPELLA
jgi:hypothetical protein